MNPLWFAIGIITLLVTVASISWLASGEEDEVARIRRVTKWISRG